MKYERCTSGHYIHEATFSCAFKTCSRDFAWVHREVAAGGWTNHMLEDLMWKQLCILLTASERRSVIVTTTDNEPGWRDLLAACPYAELIDEVASLHGVYQVQLWIVRQHERNGE